MFDAIGRQLAIAAVLSAPFMAGSFAVDARAHEGPPFPLFMDKALGDIRLSLWADPDIGDARFFVIVETPEGKVPHHAPQVSLWTEPVNGRLSRQTYAAQPQSLRNRMQFEAKPFFDQQDHWRVGVTLKEANGKELEMETIVESTPPGLGYWDLAIYLFPFLMLGALWTAAVIRGRRRLPNEVDSSFVRLNAETHFNNDPAIIDPAVIDPAANDSAAIDSAANHRVVNDSAVIDPARTDGAP